MKKTCENIIPKIILMGLLVMSLGLMVEKNIRAEKEDVVCKPVYGGTLKIGMFIEPTIIHPLYTTYSRSVTICDLIFSQLIRFDHNSQPVPDLAERWDVSDDGLTYTFHLRKGVMFHDGVECTAEDVKFTYDAIMNAKNESPYHNYFTNIKKVTVISNYTIQITLKERMEYDFDMFNKWIMPKHVFDGDVRKENSSKKLIGSGPFVFSSMTEEKRIIICANESYYDGRPYLDAIEFVSINRDALRGNTLLKQEVDMVNFLTLHEFTYAVKDPTFETFIVDTDHYYALTYDLDDEFIREKKALEM